MIQMEPDGSAWISIDPQSSVLIRPDHTGKYYLKTEVRNGFTPTQTEELFVMPEIRQPIHTDQAIALALSEGMDLKPTTLHKYSKFWREGKPLVKGEAFVPCDKVYKDGAHRMIYDRAEFLKWVPLHLENDPGLAIKTTDTATPDLPAQAVPPASAQTQAETKFDQPNPNADRFVDFLLSQNKDLQKTIKNNDKKIFKQANSIQRIQARSNNELLNLFKTFMFLSSKNAPELIKELQDMGYDVPATIRNKQNALNNSDQEQ